MVGLNMDLCGKVASLGLAVAVLFCSSNYANAADVSATSTIIMNDTFHTKKEWGDKLVLPKDGTITRVMDGTYGFDIKTVDGVKVASFLDPQDAIGYALPAGAYVIDPYVCKLHRHHHISVKATY